MRALPTTRAGSWSWILTLAVVSVLALPSGPQARDEAEHTTLAAAPAPETSKHDGHAAAPPVETAEAEIALSDLELRDSQGRSLLFASEAIGERIVAIDFVYTTCTTICPILSAVFANVQDELGDRLGKDVWLVTISIDPARDTPRRMRKYAKRFGAKPGWIWLTGEKTTVDQVLTGLGAYTPDIEDHPPMFIVGDAKAGTWKRLFGLSISDQVLAQLEALLAARQSNTSHMTTGNKP